MGRKVSPSSAFGRGEGFLDERLPAAVFWGVCAGLVGVAGVGMMWFRNSGDDS
mgnify:CR=1 FL=1